MARDTWTDERLDDLNRRVDDGFTEMREELRAVRAEIGSESRAVRAEIGSVRAEAGAFRSEVGQQFAAQQRMMIQLFGGMFAMVALGFLGVIATILTQV